MKNQSNRNKKALFLYFELAGYVVACLERFAAKYAVDVHLVRYPVNAIAPQAAIYLTIKFDLVGKRTFDGVLKSQEEVTEYLLSAAKLAVVPFYAFGAEKQSPWYRLSVGTCKINDIEAFLQNLKKALQALQ